MNWNEHPLVFAYYPSTRECQLLRQFRMAAATPCPPGPHVSDIRDKWADPRQAFISAACRPILSQRMDMPRIKTQRNEPAAIARGHAPLAETPRRNVHHAKRHELNGRTGAIRPTFQLLGTPWGSSEVDGKVPASLPAHSPHTAPRLLRRSPFTCPKVENASQRAGNQARNPARSPLEALGGDASPPQRPPSARADDHTPV